MKTQEEFYCSGPARLFVEPRQYTFVAVAVVGVGAAATAYSASQQAKSAKAANKTNISNAQKDRDLNLALDREHHGEGGYANFARYAKDSAGNPFEPQLFAQTLKTYNNVNALSPSMEDYQAIAGQAAPGQAGAVRTVDDLYSGKTQDQLLADQGQVSAGRIAQAYVAKGTALEALASTINEIKAIGARKGYKSDGMANNFLNFEARRGAYNAGATGLANANVLNAQDNQRIKAGVLGTQLQNTTMPYQVAKAGIGTANLAADAMIDRTGRNAQLFRPFQTNPSSLQYGPLPETVPIPSTGAIAGTFGASALDKGYAAYGLAQGAAGAGAGGTGTYGSRTAAQQAAYERDAIQRYG